MSISSDLQAADVDGGLGYANMTTVAGTATTSETAGSFDFGVKHVVVTHAGAANTLYFRAIPTGDILFLFPGQTHQIDLMMDGFTVESSTSTVVFSVTGLG